MGVNFDKSNFDRIFNELKDEFPFKDYIDNIYYWEMKTLISNLFKLSIDLKNKNLLDIGSGPMDKTAIFANYGCNCYAVDDLSDPWHKLNDNLKLIKNFSKKYSINFKHQLEGDYSIPFKEDYFDIATSFCVIEHLHQSPALLLNKIGIHLKTNGYGIVVMPNSVNLRKRIDVLLGKSNYNPLEEIFFSDSDEGIFRGHVREYTLKELKDIVRWSGFNIIFASHFEHLAEAKLNPIFSKIYKSLGNLIPSFRSGIVTIFQKPSSWKEVKLTQDQYFKYYPAPVKK